MDKNYWDNYYYNHSKDKGIQECSTFAKFCLDKFFIKDELNIVELGSGNGRDALYFARHQLNIIAIDQSTIAREVEKESLEDNVVKYLDIRSQDFIREDYSKYNSIDVFYSRFTIHAINKKDEELLLPNLYNSLNNGGLLCIEVRTTKDSLFGVGEDCGENTYITDHKRRFIDSSIFLNQVLKLGFKLLYFTEENNLSIYKGDNPVLMRIILEK